MGGRLVVFEGTEGVGKSTQLHRLAAALDAVGRAALLLREPGGTPLGDEVRRLVLDPATGIEVDAAAEALLFMASRAQLVERVIRPALRDGRTVLVDRFLLSTYAYQVHGRGLDADRVRAANRLAVGDLVPDLTLLLRLPGAEGMRRAAHRSGPDRIERIGSAFHERVAAAFTRFIDPDWQRANPESGPIVAVDATGEPEAVAERIGALLHGRWPETFPAPAGSMDGVRPAPPARRPTG